MPIQIQYGTALVLLVFVLTMNFGFGRGYLFGLAEKFNLNDEMNFPTLVATLELFACSAMLAANAGCDMDMESRSYMQNLASLVNEGKVKLSVVDCS